MMDFTVSKRTNQSQNAQKPQKIFVCGANTTSIIDYGIILKIPGSSGLGGKNVFPPSAQPIRDPPNSPLLE